MTLIALLMKLANLGVLNFPSVLDGQEIKTVSAFSRIMITAEELTKNGILAGIARMNLKEKHQVSTDLCIYSKSIKHNFDPFRY